MAGSVAQVPQVTSEVRLRLPQTVETLKAVFEASNVPDDATVTAYVDRGGERWQSEQSFLIIKWGGSKLLGGD